LGGAVVGSQAAGHLTSPHHDGDAFGGQSGPGHADIAGTNVPRQEQPGGAGLASAPPSAMDHQQGQQSGMPMGGIGGTGGGQAGGEHHHKAASQWRTHGRLFDDDRDDESLGRFSGTLDDGR
jgi:hypothetical protein